MTWPFRCATGQEGRNDNEGKAERSLRSQVVGRFRGVFGAEGKCGSVSEVFIAKCVRTDVIRGPSNVCAI